jgi:hypothetical protein
VSAFGERIRAERLRQDRQWGGPVHDDMHTIDEWLAFIEYQASAGYELDPHGRAASRFVKIGSLCRAARASQERLRAAGRSGGEAPPGAAP